MGQAKNDTFTQLRLIVRIALIMAIVGLSSVIAFVYFTGWNEVRVNNIYEEELARRKSDPSNSPDVDLTEKAALSVRGGKTEITSSALEPSAIDEFSSHSHNLEPSDLPQLLEKVDGGIVQIIAKDERGRGYGTGSGFVVNDACLVVTNYHVIDDAHAADVIFRDGKKYKVLGCRAWDGDGDLAVLEIEKPPAKFEIVKIATELPEVGESVVAVGHPSGFRYTSTLGEVAALQKTRELPEPFNMEIDAPDEYQWVQTTTLITGGNSGGPLLNGAAEVIGVNTWIVERAKLGFAASGLHVAELLKKTTDKAVPFAELTAPANKIKSAISGYDGIMDNYRTRLERAKTPEQIASLEKQHPALSTSRELLKMVKDHPQSPARTDALDMLVRVLCNETCPASCDALLLETLRTIDSAKWNDKRTLRLAFLLGRCRHNSGFSYLKRMAQKHENRTIRAVACFSLGASKARQTERDPKCADEAISFYRYLVKNYPDVEPAGFTDMIATVKEQIYILENLAIGRIAPEIEGPDATGTDFMLSDYRGKVVLLCFFADKDSFSRSYYTLVRKLADKHKNAPFVVLGVLCDSSPERLQQLIEAKTITWRCWFDGDAGLAVDDYKIDEYPTTYLLDATGTIRHKDIPPAKINELTNKLLAEVKTEKK
ncbi:MAG: trypsin-like peptidase domain-containing protein [Pirellulales bacterium]|nr:trypsin-like peptidase domain-containing protein [Pirellulales bacterium]